MGTTLRVSLYHGAWNRNDDGFWNFQRKPSDLGYSVLIKPTETFENVQTIIRARYQIGNETSLAMAYHPPEWMLEPDGTRRPLLTVSSNSEVEAMMHLRSWFTDLKLCISSGYKDVANFHFLMKTTFTVGDATFVFNGYSDEELVASKEILEELFSEHEMVAIYRAHLEITKAKQEQEERAAQSSVSSTKITKDVASGSNPSVPGE
ncbi:Uncharacterized protein Rs2_41243 [Raphanus sativus]|uniref:Uncharacterized protein LOC130499766 n=1 Tax=Raphanus sativus TaxID=3726 RepID=A0A9W3CF05_RAPSA|nr:uncharacterized protein LOC130499766 [Raphanus sativus]KAJ4876225.1 Uncharacterized protein Rs2_41243 [Raphanus sativus]